MLLFRLRAGQLSNHLLDEALYSIFHKEIVAKCRFQRPSRGITNALVSHDAQSERKQYPGQDDWRLSNSRLFPSSLSVRKYLRPLIVIDEVK